MLNMADKIQGVVFGTAIGDALGYPVEFHSAPQVTTLVQNPLYSDDTQMFLATCEGLLAAETWDNEDAAAQAIAEYYVRWSRSPENNRAPGNACMRGCARLGERVPWRSAGAEDAGGSGSAMRSMAYGIWHWSDPAKAAAWAASHSRMTHGHAMATASSAAVAAGVAYALQGMGPALIMRAMCEIYHTYRPGDLQLWAARGMLDVGPEVVLDRFRAWRGDEAAAGALYCFGSCSDSWVKATLRAVNSPGDSDTLGAITGALAGAMHGINGIPVDWCKRIENSDMLLKVATRLIAAVMPD